MPSRAAAQPPTDATPKPAPPEHRRLGRRRLGSLARPLAEAAGVAAIAIAFASYLYRVWEVQLSIPIADWSPDAWGGGALLKNMHDGGWILTNSHLGAPFHQQSYDFPQAGETLQMAGVKFLALFSGRPYLVMNVYYLLGFGVLAAVTYLVVRHLRFSVAVSATVALMYTFLAYHFAHQEGHLYRSAYVSGPLGVLIIFWAMSWRTWFLREPDGPMRPWAALRGNLRWRRVVGALAIAGTLGVTETIATLFILVGIAVVCLLAAARDRDPGTIVAGALLGLVVLATFALSMAPNYWYWHVHGTNKVAARRVIAEQELYGLKLDEVVLPDQNSYIEALRNPMQQAQKKSPVPSEPGQALGILGAVGFVALLIWALGFWNRAGPRRAHHDPRSLKSNASILTLVMALFGTIAGFAVLLSLAGLSQVRTWNRVVVFLGFCALLAVGLALERILGWLRRRTRPPLLTNVVCVAVLIVAFAVNFWTGPVPERQKFETVREVQELKGLGQQLRGQLPANASVFQLPVMPYPENGSINQMQDYAEILPYVFTDGLRWSYGAMKGRPEADWQLKINSADPTAQLPGLRGLGYDGILVDVYGYSDKGADITARLDAALGPPTVQSDGGRWRFWDLRSYAAANHLSTEQLRQAATDLVGTKLIKQVPTTPGASAPG